MRRLPLLAELCLLALLAWLLAGWLLPSAQDNPAGSQPQTTSGAASLAQPALSELIAVPLFGKVTAPQSVPQPIRQPQPVLKPLQIILIGTVMAGEHSAAVVSVDGKPEQQTVFVGEQIQPGVTLIHVDGDAIVVEQAGRRQLVSLQREVLQGMTISEDQSTAPGKHMADAGEAPVTHMPDKNASSLQSDKEVLPARPRVAGLARLLTQATFTPHVSSDGKQDGLQISHIVIGSPFQKNGLFNGDVIRAVNGQVFNHAEQSLDLLRIIQAPGAIDFEIMRAGKVQRIHVVQ